MVPMTELLRGPVEPVLAFYDRLAQDYDAMTGFADRFVRERPFFRLLVDRYNIATALDAGAGTGFHSMLLAELGVDVTAVEISESMVERLRLHARERSLGVRALVGDIREMSSFLTATVDGVFCMGNTLAHLEPPGELDKALAACVSSLSPGGLLVIQVVNFDRLLDLRETIQSIRERDGVIFVRFYQYEARAIRFHILRIWKQGPELQHRLETVLLHPLGRETLLDALQRAGCVDIRAYGAISLEEFDPQNSRDLIVLARKAS